ncbi:MAG TPA: cytochrome C [Geobacteraceae bacterium]
MKKDYTWNFGQEKSSGDRHGHNIVALDYGFEPDRTLHFAPGGAYPSANLSCISCHDPHGNYRRLANGSISTAGPPIIASGSYSNSPDPSATGSVGTYRLLAGKGYQPAGIPGVPAFTADPPVAVSPPLYNRAETSSDTRVAYGRGMSEWCQNCHPQINGLHQHPVGSDTFLSPEVTNNYNAYISSGNMSGRMDVAYTSLVPFELRTNDYSLLKRVANSDNTVRSGPTGTASIMCLSCHRAHASGWDSIMRWNVKADFIVYDGMYPGTDTNVPAAYAQGRLSTETQKTFYDRPATYYAPYQRSLCNKCHGKD